MLNRAVTAWAMVPILITPSSWAAPLWERHARLACEGTQQYWCSMSESEAACKVEQSDVLWLIDFEQGRVEYLNTEFEEAIEARLSKRYQGVDYDHLLLESGRVLYLVPPQDPPPLRDPTLVARAALASLSPPLIEGASGFAGGYTIITWMHCHVVGSPPDPDG
jgi:hypothetical protein